MAKAKMSLLEAATNYRRSSFADRASKKTTPEHYELALAWLKYEVTSAQAAFALSCSVSNVHHSMSKILREGVRAGHIEVVLKGPKK